MSDRVVRMKLVDSTPLRVERCLKALTDCIGDESLPKDVRKELAFAHAALHRCRPARVVEKLEQDKGLR